MGLTRQGLREVIARYNDGQRSLLRPESPARRRAAIGALLEALDLRQAVLVGNDTGGALCQLALRADRSRIGGLVLTNCDAFENFPPRFFKPLFWLARYRATAWPLLQPTRLRAIRHSPLGFGLLLDPPRSAELTRGWLRAPLRDRRIRRGVTRFARGITGSELVGAAAWLRDFTGPVEIVWGVRDRCFTLDTARRLAAAFPQARLEQVPDATTFVPVDRPDAVAGAVQRVIARLPGPADHS